MIKTNKLRGRIVENGLTIERLAEQLGIHRGTLHRKMHEGEFTVREVQSLIRILNLSPDDVTDIFFGDDVA